MAKDPAFLFYPGDFNTGTQFFSDEQVGKYMRLLMAQHQHGHLTEQQVLFICKSYDKEVMTKFVKDSAGLWYNERLEIESNKRKKFIQSRSENREGKTKEKIISKTHVKHVENRNENKDLNNKSNGEFEIFSDWVGWGKLIVDDCDAQWQDMRGRKVSQDEMDGFLSVATRNKWKIESHGAFRISLKGFDWKTQLNGKKESQKNRLDNL